MRHDVHAALGLRRPHLGVVVMRMTDIETIREAARLMRQRAQAATTGPWYEDCTDGIYAYGGPDADCPAVFARVGVGSYSDVEHAAAFASPPVALALADWLEAEAEHHEARDAAVAAATGDGWQVRLSASTLPQAVAVARAYLGVES